MSPGDGEEKKPPASGVTRAVPRGESTVPAAHLAELQPDGEAKDAPAKERPTGKKTRQKTRGHKKDRGKGRRSRAAQVRQLSSSPATVVPKVEVKEVKWEAPDTEAGPPVVSKALEPTKPETKKFDAVAPSVVPPPGAPGRPLTETRAIPAAPSQAPPPKPPAPVEPPKAALRFDDDKSAPAPAAPATSEGKTRSTTRVDKESGTLAGFVSATRRFLKKFTGAPPEVRISLPKSGDIRLFKLAGEIDDRLALQAATWLLFVQAMKADADVVLTVDSPGGSITAGMSLIEVLLKATCRVRTHCTRQALGIASIVVASGSRGYRTLEKASILSLPGGPTWGDGKRGETTSRMSPRLLEIVARSSAKSLKDVEREFQKKPSTFGAKQAVNLGLADAVAVFGG